MIFECRPDKEYAIVHGWDEKEGRTFCALEPTTQELDRGTFAFDHEMPEGEKRCLLCYR